MSRPTVRHLLLPLALLPASVTMTAAAAQDRPDPVPPTGCISIPEFQHIKPGATRAQIDATTHATGRVANYDPMTSPGHRFVVMFYRSCEAPTVDYARVEVLYFRHAPTRTAFRATLVMTNMIGGS